MKKYIEDLYKISQKNDRLIVGLMSGTSLDGLDIALCKINGNGRFTKIKLQQFTTVPYDEAFKNELRKLFSKRDIDQQLLVVLNAHIGKLYGTLVNRVLKHWGVKNSEIDLIASHGQTIFHAPTFVHQLDHYDNATLQIGDADHIAVQTGIITLSDFRQKHIASGGEGAPLSVYGDYLIFSDETENRIMLNIGGIANFTWLPNNEFTLSHPCFSTDVGPGNTLMDAFVRKYFDGMAFDANGKLAAIGQINDSLLKQLLSHPFFLKNIPKTIGPELFNLEYLSNAMKNVAGNPSNEDILATLNKFTAAAIIKAICEYTVWDKNCAVYISGGGIHNDTLMRHLAHSSLSKIVFRPSSYLGFNPDAKEAMLFALLANECIAGNGMGIGKNMKGTPDISMGKISFPI